MDGSKTVLGMDMGGTNLRLGIVDDRGRVRRLINKSLGEDKSVDRVIAEIVSRIEELVNWSHKKSLKVEAVCLAAPGIISKEDGTIVFSPNLPGWKNVCLKDIICREVGLPTSLENDANAAAFGEFWKGSGSGARHMVMFTLGTGVGGGVITEGKLVRGYRGMAGELGHMTVEPSNGRLCRCGNRGCLEAYSSATAVVERIAEKWQEEGTPPATARDACLLAEDGNKLCRRTFQESGFYLGMALADVVNILNPEVIVIGGGVIEAWDLFMPAAENELHSRAFRFTDLAEKVSVRKARLGNEAGVIGSAGIYWSESKD